MLELGDELIQEFKVEHDTLGRWMCHDLADKLSAYRSAKGSSRSVLATDITSKIFQFWKHRATLPEGVRPFDAYSPVLRALESLDPQRPGGRYYNYDFIRPDDKKGGNKEVAGWLSIARGVDRGARSLITLCLGCAAHAAGRPNDKWLRAADVLAEDDNLEIKSVIRIVQASDLVAAEK